MNMLWRSKLYAFSIHLLFSATIIGIFMLIVTKFWFPDILFALENVWQGLQILIPTDAVLGPVLTLVLFVPGKKGLVGDLLIVALVQVLALVYGGYTIYNQRPEIIVFVADRFEIIPSAKFDRENFQSQHFSDTEITFPFILYALPGQNAIESSEFAANNVQYQKMSERYRPLSDHLETVRAKALQLSKLVPEDDQSRADLEQFKTQHDINKTLLFILQGTTSEAVIIALNSDDLTFIGYLDLDPWTEYHP